VAVSVVQEVRALAGAAFHAARSSPEVGQPLLYGFALGVHVGIDAPGFVEGVVVA
jgi:hypothetical protein